MANTPDWIRNGRELGRERALIDLKDGTVSNPEELWIPAGTPPEYAEALCRSYSATLAGTTMALDI